MRRTGYKLGRRREPGICLGVRESTTEKIVGTKAGILVVQSIRRQPEGSRYDNDLLNEARGLPWDPSARVARLFARVMLPLTTQRWSEQ
eukprot:4575724-Lingulodinium_polyedra.AAC.1